MISTLWSMVVSLKYGRMIQVFDNGRMVQRQCLGILGLFYFSYISRCLVEDVDVALFFSLRFVAFWLIGWLQLVLGSPPRLWSILLKRHAPTLLAVSHLLPSQTVLKRFPYLRSEDVIGLYIALSQPSSPFGLNISVDCAELWDCWTFLVVLWSWDKEL